MLVNKLMPQILFNTDDNGGSGGSGNNGGQSNDGLQTVPISEYRALESKYNGQSGYVNQLKQQLESEKAKVQSITQQYEEQVATLTNERDTARTELDTVKPQLDVLNGKVSKFEKDRELGAKIAKEYPALSELHSENLLRTDGLEGEELDTYLANMAGKLGKFKQDAQDETIEGATLPTPEGQGNLNLTVDQMADQLMKLRPDTKEYQAMEQAYFAALDKK